MEFRPGIYINTAQLIGPLFTEHSRICSVNMIVYGDPKYSATVAELTVSLIKFADYARCSVTGARDFLIAAGQFEQAIADSHTSNEATRLAERLTELAAEAFAGDLLKSPKPAEEITRNILDEIVKSIDGSLSLTVKIPEGYAFYSLFPEQYVASTQKWINDHRCNKRTPTLVIGIRSIGTSLSALVAATLKASGFINRRVTVRPEGAPFNRHAQIGIQDINGSSYALIVDEGPGASGSSMAAVADALVNAGLPANRITFMPSHAGEPGTAASATVKSWWTNTPRYSVPFEALCWNGSTVPEHLCQRTQEILETTDRISIHDVSGGNWRNFAYDSNTSWPAVWPMFERTKFLCAAPTAKLNQILWKFAGLGPSHQFAETLANAQFNRMKHLAETGPAVEPLAICDGFIAMPWLDGTRLSAGDFDDDLLRRIVSHLANSVGSQLDEPEALEAFDRLRFLVRINLEKGLGTEYARSAVQFVDSFKPEVNLCRYTDGHMAPHEWLHTPEGTILKTDTTGHECDHTIIGNQSILWDIAGTAVEWCLDAAVTKKFIEALESRDIKIDQRTFAFYRIAYAAFKMGQFRFACEAVDESDERHRLKSTASIYETDLLSTLKSMDTH